ncbi:MAG: hypothetical protein ILA07_08170 [Prevotella sp.]|jgi:uncharacterized coiled-coil DUF342 family protein|nr:hypothetical protein [Prevotella sp.]
MDRKEIIAQIDRLRDELLKLDAKDTTLAETIAYCNQRQDRIRQKKREIHTKVNALKVEIAKLGL